MSFSYILGSSDATMAAIARVRLEIGDTTEGAGVLPDGSNFSNEEIAVYLTTYASDVPQAVNALAGVLARRWATVADVTVGPRSESLSQVSKAWAAIADKLGGSEAGSVFSMAPTRVDGYSENAAEDEYGA